MNSERIDKLRKFATGSSEIGLVLSDVILEAHRKISEKGYTINIMTSSTDDGKQVHMVSIRKSLSTNLVDIISSNSLRSVIVDAFCSLIKKEGL